VFGKNAHASFPPAGKNAVTALIAVLASLATDDGAGELFARASQAFVHGESDGRALGLNVRDEKSGALTFAFSIMNYENGKFSGKFDIRFPICESVAGIRAKAEEGLGRHGISLVNMTGVEPHYVSEDSPFIRTLLRVYRNMTGLQGRTIAIGGGTYVHNTEGGVAFGCAFPGENNKMHGAGEYMALGSLKLNAEIFANAILEICK
ncbi:MAG: peptidase dimerization domain-containing protein, partial [Ruminococcus sp.]|nr:peptidase dimerization domain-containing protein [Candidatus Apopatosoma intestinale]